MDSSQKVRDLIGRLTAANVAMQGEHYEHADAHLEHCWETLSELRGAVKLKLAEKAEAQA